MGAHQARNRAGVPLGRLVLPRGKRAARPERSSKRTATGSTTTPEPSPSTPPRGQARRPAIAAEKIEEIARALAEAAPHCYVDLQWAGTLGSGYANSAEQIRALLLLNALLGNFNQEGGLIFPTSPWLGDDALDQTVFVPTGQPAAPTAGEGDFALSRSTSCQAGLRAGLQAAVLCECDPVSDWPDAAGTAEAFDAIPFKAVIATELTPAAKRADYVLPALTFLERPGIVGTATSVTSMATLRNQVIEPVAPDAKAVYEIVTDLAGHLGLSEYFAFTLDDYNEALCAAYGVSYDELRRASVAELPGCTLQYGSMPFMMSASGKVEFSCDAFAAAGRSATPEWVEPAVQALRWEAAPYHGRPVHPGAHVHAGRRGLAERRRRQRPRSPLGEPPDSRTSRHRRWRPRQGDLRHGRDGGDSAGDRADPPRCRVPAAPLQPR